MKRLISSVTLIMLFGVMLSGQNTVMTTWPYLYPEFATGTAYLSDGKKYESEMNIHLAKGRLHFIDKGIIKEMRIQDIVLVELNGVNFTVVDGNVVQAIGDLDKGYVAVHTVIDYQRLNETGGAYGTSSTSSATTRMSSVDMPGVNTNHMELRRNRDTGKEAALKTEYYLVVSGRVYDATKKGVESQLDEAGKAAFKTFQKQNKIKWKDPQSLLTVVDFLCQQ